MDLTGTFHNINLCFNSLVRNSGCYQSHGPTPPPISTADSCQGDRAGTLGAERWLSGRYRRVASETVEALRCQNEALQTNLDGHVSLLEQLTSLPEEVAIKLLQDLRVRPISYAFMDSALGSMHAQHRPSDLAAAQSLCPRTYSSLEFELAARHQFIYPKSTPLDPAQLVAFLNSPGTETLETPHSCQFCDARLHNLQIHFWTRVPIPNRLAASAISFYLETDHLTAGVFDADLFLTDLVEQRLQHCSSFLVSALLCFACPTQQAYARNDARSLSFVSALFQEATTLWHSERSSTRNHDLLSDASIFESLTTLAATLLMSLASHVNGRDESAFEFLHAGRQIATELGLLDAAFDNDQLDERFGKRSQQWIRSASYVAWGTYNWISFWEIVQEIIIVYYEQDHRPLRERVSLAFAEAKYQKLLAWTNSLGSAMSLAENSPAHVLIFQ
ncbi:hypothetical protein E4U41_000583 [Claviceps citrina]|nr:hypothetical protein E4U41_000583 [Claviceps citrina]